MVIKRKLRYLGHIERSDDYSLQRILLHGELNIGRRNSGRPLIGYRDSLKSALRLFGIDTSTWAEIALDKRRWRNIINKEGGSIYMREWFRIRNERSKNRNKKRNAGLSIGDTLLTGTGNEVATRIDSIADFSDNDLISDNEEDLISDDDSYLSENEEIHRSLIATTDTSGGGVESLKNNSEENQINTVLSLPDTSCNEYEYNSFIEMVVNEPDNSNTGKYAVIPINLWHSGTMYETDEVYNIWKGVFESKNNKSSENDNYYSNDGNNENSYADHNLNKNWKIMNEDRPTEKPVSQVTNPNDNRISDNSSEESDQNLVINKSRKRRGRGKQRRMERKRQYLTKGNGRNEDSRVNDESEEVIMDDI